MFSMRTATMFLFFALFVTVAFAQEGKILNIGYNSFTHFKGTCLKIFHLGDIIQTADFLSELKLYTKIFLRFIRNTAGLDYQIWVNKYFFFWPDEEDDDLEGERAGKGHVCASGATNYTCTCANGKKAPCGKVSSKYVHQPHLHLLQRKESTLRQGKLQVCAPTTPAPAKRKVNTLRQGE